MLTTPSATWPSCTIVVPCFNEARRLNVDAFRKYAQKAGGVRFLFVNDGSSDDTLDMLRRLSAEAGESMAVLDLRCNQGKAEAVRRGILAALEDGAALVGFWDADLATPLDAIGEFTACFATEPELRMVLGSRVRLLGRHIERRTLRHYLGRVFATAASLALGMSVYDTQCGAKMFRACPEVRALFANPFRTRWIFDVEILARWIQTGRGRSVETEILELPLRAWRDVPGSKLRWRDFARAAWSLADIYWTYLRPARRRLAAAPLTTREASTSDVASGGALPVAARPR